MIDNLVCNMQIKRSLAYKFEYLFTVYAQDSDLLATRNNGMLFYLLAIFRPLLLLRRRFMGTRAVTHNRNNM